MSFSTEEKELDYEGPLSSEDEDPYSCCSPHSTSDKSLSEVQDEFPVSCCPNTNFLDLSSNADPYVAQGERNHDDSNCRDDETASRTTDAAPAFSSLHRASLVTTPSLSDLEQDPDKFKSRDLSSQPSSSSASTAPDSQKNRTQTVQVNFLASHSLPHSRGISSVKPRSILKVKEKYGSCNKVVDSCMIFLCDTPSFSSLQACAQQVFENACFDELFEGTCINSMCVKDHDCVPDITELDVHTVWRATQFVIWKSSKPKIEILKTLVRYFSGSRDPTTTLALAKCIPKLSHANQADFAQYLVDHLAHFAERKNAVIWVLFISYSDLDSDAFNDLMDCLDVFKQDSTSYLDLFEFLNFRAHILPYRKLVKLIEDIVTCCSPQENSDFFGVIYDFLDRLPEAEKEKMESVVSRFMNKFDICSLNEFKKRRITGSMISETHPSKGSHLPLSYKKHVKFVENDNPEDVIVPDHTPLPHYITAEKYPPEFRIDEMKLIPETSNDDPTFNEYVSSVLEVFQNLCLDWILNGACQNPMCESAHHLVEDFLDSIPTEKFNIAVEFIIDRSVHPDIKVLEIFLNVLDKSNDINKLLLFRKCASKLTSADSSKLTILVLSRLSRHMDKWDAVETVLNPDLLDIGSKHTDMFLFDSNLLKSVMAEAINRKNHLFSCISNEILRRVSLLSANERENIMETTVTFFRKFFIDKENQLNCPDLCLSMESFKVINKFSSQFETELHKGITNKYFVVCLMIKYAIEEKNHLKEEALDTLYSFLTVQVSRTRILNGIMGNCFYFNVNARKAIFDLLGNAGLCIILRFIEEGNLAGASEIFVVLRKFKLNLFELEHKFFQVSDLELSLMFCELCAECNEHTDAIKIFLSHCLKSLMTHATMNSSLVNQTNELAEKLLWKLNSKLLWSESLALFNGIHSMQKSLSHPLNILKFYESTLRTTQAFPWNRKARLACLKLFLGMEDTGIYPCLQKFTFRSLLLTGVNHVYASFALTHSRGLPNYLHPLIRKLLAVSIASGAFAQFNPAGNQITLYSSMTVDEIKIYLVWWLYHMNLARKRAHVDFFFPVNLNIIQDCITDGCPLPIHFTLQNVDNSFQACGDRLLTALKSLCAVPVSSLMFRHLGRDRFELSPEAIGELSQVVVNCLRFHHTNDLLIQQLPHTCCNHRNRFHFV